MRKILIITFLLCWQSVMANPLVDKMYENWIAAISYEESNPDLNLWEPIRRPEGTWQEILEVVYYSTTFGKLKDCLFFYVPLGNEPGILKLKELRYNEKCSDFLLKEGTVEQKGIYNLAFNFKNQLDSKYHLRIKIDKEKYDFLFPNFSTPGFPTEKLAPAVELSTFTGISVGVPSIRTTSRIPKLRDGTICFDVDNECNVKIANKCDQCINSSYLVVASNCAGRFRQVCGPDKCGQRNGPACIRGRSATGYKLDYCINDSPIGFCTGDLRVMCLGNVLICN